MIFLELRGEILPGCTSGLIDQIRAASGRAESITLRINSAGGDIAEAELLANALRGADVPTTAVVLGAARCESAATLVLLACGRRCARTSACFLVHNARPVAGTGATPADAAAVSARMATIYARATGHSADSWRMLMERETLMDARAALAISLIHEVVP